MVEPGYGEHPNREEGYGYADCRKTPSNPKDSKTSEVDQDERNDPEPVYMILVGHHALVDSMSVKPECDFP